MPYIRSRIDSYGERCSLNEEAITTTETVGNEDNDDANNSTARHRINTSIFSDNNYRTTKCTALVLKVLYYFRQNTFGSLSAHLYASVHLVGNCSCYLNL